MPYPSGRKLLIGYWQDVTGDPERDALIMAMAATARAEL